MIRLNLSWRLAHSAHWMMPCRNSKKVTELQQANQTLSCSTIEATVEITAYELISAPIITIKQKHLLTR